MRRILFYSFVFSVFLLGHAWDSLDAQQRTVKLCGFPENLADSLILSGFDPSSGPFVLNTSWVDRVPTLFTLLGNLTFVRDTGDVNTFIGGGTLTNNSEAFANNPTCAANATIEVTNSAPLTVAGTAQYRCIGGSGSPFIVSFPFELAPCDDPGPFDQASQRMALSGERPTLADMPNEYRAP
jgi:hypothetical protein